MNLWQALQQIKFLLLSARWDDAATAVFPETSVLCTVGGEADAINDLPVPVVLIGPLDYQVDPEHRQDAKIEKHRVSVLLMHVAVGDKYGEAALLGSARTEGKNSSLGRGILEIEGRMNDTVSLLNEADGVTIQASHAGGIAASISGMRGYLATRETYYELVCTSQKSYAPARAMTAVRAGGNVNLAWKLAPTRWDTRRVMLRRLAGAVAPVLPTDGVEVALGSDLPSAFVDAVGAGTYSYSLFMVYDEFGEALDGQFSPPTSRTVN